MEKLIAFGIALILVASCQNDCPEQTEKVVSLPETNEVVYDSTYAAKIGADDYGMSQYVVAFLKTGTYKPSTKQETDSLMRLHLDNITRLANDGKLVVAGPFMDGTELRGIFIFNTSSVEDAKEMTLTDPAVAKGVFEMEYHQWYGAAALKDLDDLYKKSTKIDI